MSGLQTSEPTVRRAATRGAAASHEAGVVRTASLEVETARCRDLDAGRNLEWLVTNGRGGYAMAGLNGVLTRRYHGLLVAAVKPPLERFVLLAKLDATIVIDGLTYELGTNDYPEAVHPNGYKLLERFRPRPFPQWRWQMDDVVVEQDLCMVPGEDTTCVRFRMLSGPPSVRIVVRPLGTSRHFHSLGHRADVPQPEVEQRDGALTLKFGDGRPQWHLSFNGRFEHKPDWYYEFVLTAEAARGQDHRQDLFTPGVIQAELKRGDETGLTIVASTQPRPWSVGAEAFRRAGAATETTPAKPALATVRPAPIQLGDDSLIAPLVAASSDFLVARADGSKTVIAGYPWFGDWGRDTFIALPGLCLVPGRYDDARQIIDGFAAYVSEGMIPNRFPDYGQPPAYNNVDGTLWYIHALDRYVAYSGDWDFVAKKMYPVIVKILEAHERGTRHGIRLDEDGLLSAGAPGEQLTWMDAKIGDWVVTPRSGKPVEVQALWYNALRVAASFATRMNDAARANRWLTIAERCRAAFNGRFWCDKNHYLHDVIDVNHVGGAIDDALRPNQLLAISLTHPLLDASFWGPVTKLCEERLWTPMGLRTLAPGHAAYRPRYEGDMTSRDSAYHQGTVWPWLLGPMVTAFVRTHGGSGPVRTEARRLLSGLERHLADAGLGSVSEVADADPPHRPGGCPWQAWSVAEPLRALCEDILRTRPGRGV